MFVRLIVYLSLGLYLWLPVLSLADVQSGSKASLTIMIKAHQFIPSQLNVPAGQKLQITVDNQDQAPEEFESFDLDREQVVEGHQKISVFIGPLKPGIYKYWGDYHQDTTKGIIVAR